MRSNCSNRSQSAASAGFSSLLSRPPKLQRRHFFAGLLTGIKVMQARGELDDDDDDEFGFGSDDDDEEYTSDERKRRRRRPTGRRGTP